ncbi:MAG: biotin/lipoyl-containing protein [Lachnospiraceae bacterium]
MKYLVKWDKRQIEVEVEVIEELPPVAGVPNLKVESPKQGSIVKIGVSVGQSVAEGDTLIVMEAMKEEHDITAPRAGMVKQILVSQGTIVSTGDILVVLK